MGKLLAFICAISFASFPVLGNDIETKADLEKMVIRYEKAAQLGKLCTASKMKDVRSCDAFQQIYLSGLEEELQAVPNNLSSYMKIDVDFTLRSIAAFTSIAESVIDIVSHNNTIKTDVRGERAPAAY